MCNHAREKIEASGRSTGKHAFPKLPLELWPMLGDGRESQGMEGKPKDKTWLGRYQTDLLA